VYNKEDEINDFKGTLYLTGLAFIIAFIFATIAFFGFDTFWDVIQIMTKINKRY
jgi:hypothetical protein